MKEDIELVFNYEENSEIINRQKLNKIIEILSKYGRSVTIRYNFTIVANKDFEKIKNDANSLIEKLNKENLDSSELHELRPVATKLINCCLSYKIMDYYTELRACGNTLKDKSLKYTIKYLYKCVLKQLTNFVYEETPNQANDCAVCLEEFKNGNNVTKLKCGHLFCSDCIEKWLSNSITCPCCRQNPDFL